MALFINLKIGDSIRCDGPATVTFAKRDGQGAKIRVDADESVNVKHVIGSLPVANVAARGLSRERTK